MTTTIVITSTTAANSSVTISLASGDSTTLSAIGLKTGEKIHLQSDDGAGGYQNISFSEEGRSSQSVLTESRNIISVSGPLDFRINKPVTSQPVSVVQYS